MTFCQAEPQAAYDHQPPSATPPDPDVFATPTPDLMRIYVACLASYNNGHLHGAWIEVTNETAIWQAVQAMLAASDTFTPWTAAEWLIMV